MQETKGKRQLILKALRSLCVYHRALYSAGWASHLLCLGNQGCLVPLVRTLFSELRRGKEMLGVIGWWQ